MKLSILVCSLETRTVFLDRLLQCVNPQLTDDVELLVACDNGEISIGAKRNYLIDEACGDYVCFVDDDDLLAEDYVKRICEAIDLGPDCVGFLVSRLVNGKRDPFDAIHSLRFDSWGQVQIDGKHYYARTPNHLNAVRREIAQRVKFVDIDFGEDREYSQRLVRHLKSEVYIDASLYLYDYRTHRTGEVTHLTRGKH